MGFPGFFSTSKKKVQNNANLVDLEKQCCTMMVEKIGADTAANEPSKDSPKGWVPSGSFRGHRPAEHEPAR